MKSLIATFTIVLLTLAIQPVNAQENIRGFNIETEPMAYILGGVGVTGGLSAWVMVIQY